MLKVDGVTVRFGGIVALDDVKFNVESGQICALIGPNGAGKSTLFNCLSRIYSYGGGEIHFDGNVISKLPRHRMAGLGIGRTFQNLSLFPTLTAKENIMLGCHSKRRAGFFRAALNVPGARKVDEESEFQADDLIDFLGLHDDAHRIVASLPFGTQKRIELGRALASRPKLLLLDEPACGLNHQEVESLADLICNIRDNFGITVLLVEHHMNLVMKISDKVVVLNFGRKIAEGTPAEVRVHPEVVRAYLGGAHV